MRCFKSHPRNPLHHMTFAQLLGAAVVPRFQAPSVSSNPHTQRRPRLRKIRKFKSHGSCARQKDCSRKAAESGLRLSHMRLAARYDGHAGRQDEGNAPTLHVGTQEGHQKGDAIENSWHLHSHQVMAHEKGCQLSRTATFQQYTHMHSQSVP